MPFSPKSKPFLGKGKADMLFKKNNFTAQLQEDSLFPSGEELSRNINQNYVNLT
jgi:hypothetical protein